MKRLHGEAHRNLAIALGIGAFVAALTLHSNLTLIQYGQYSAQDFAFWRGVTAPIFDGHLPYSIPATEDIKPPVLYLILIAIYAAGWTVGYAVSAALAIGTVCGLLYLVATKRTHELIGLALSLLYFYGFHSLHLLENGVRPWALVFFLSSFYAVQHDKPKAAGILIALGGLTWQYVGLAVIPLLMLTKSSDRRELLKYTALVGVSILVLFNLIVPEVRGAIFYSVIVPFVYGLPMKVPGVEFTGAARRDITTNPQLWATFLFNSGYGILPLIAGGVIGTIYTRSRPILVGLGLSCIPLIAAAHTTYYLLILPWALLGFGDLIVKAAQELPTDGRAIATFTEP